ncbi:hypothetical protein DFJ77DRAFT_507408 [Powellomyces hirtus]|nr:hypothetical protein DFJ77DRAFT_507408 [Powellomyces hirtus]
MNEDLSADKPSKMRRENQDCQPQNDQPAVLPQRWNVSAASSTPYAVKRIHPLTSIYTKTYDHFRSQALKPHPKSISVEDKENGTETSADPASRRSSSPNSTEKDTNQRLSRQNEAEFRQHLSGLSTLCEWGDSMFSGGQPTRAELRCFVAATTSRVLSVPDIPTNLLFECKEIEPRRLLAFCQTEIFHPPGTRCNSAASPEYDQRQMYLVKLTKYCMKARDLMPDSLDYTMEASFTAVQATMRFLDGQITCAQSLLRRIEDTLRAATSPEELIEDLQDAFHDWTNKIGTKLHNDRALKLQMAEKHLIKCVKAYSNQRSSSNLLAKLTRFAERQKTDGAEIRSSSVNPSTNAKRPREEQDLSDVTDLPCPQNKKREVIMEPICIEGSARNSRVAVPGEPFAPAEPAPSEDLADKCATLHSLIAEAKAKTETLRNREKAWKARAKDAEKANETVVKRKFSQISTDDESGHLTKKRKGLAGVGAFVFGTALGALIGASVLAAGIYLLD